MRLTTIVAAASFLTLATLSGLATADSGGEEILTLDLRPAGGDLLFLGCTTGSKDLTRCGMLMIYEQTNGVEGLQTSQYTSGEKGYAPDQKITQ